MIMKCRLGIYLRGNYVLRCFTVLLRYTESYSFGLMIFTYITFVKGICLCYLMTFIRVFVCVSQFLKGFLKVS